MGWREFEEKSNTVTHGLTLLMLGLALGTGFVRGVNLDISTYIAAGFTCVSGLAYLWTVKAPRERAGSIERWAMWFLLCGLATMIAKFCF